MSKSMIASDALGAEVELSATSNYEINEKLVYPQNINYLGAFRLPEGSMRPLTFAYGGEAMTFNPKGDPDGPDDGFPGSLFIMGHNRMPFGELPAGNQVAEVTIPTPVISDSVTSLNQAAFIQHFHDIAAGYFVTLDEIPRVGMEYLDTPETGPLIHIAWGQHFQDDPVTNVASHAWFSPVLSSPDLQGPWFIGDQSLYSVNDYLFEIPTRWAEEHAGGKPLATGRYKDGGWSGMGPSLFAYLPWTDDSGNPSEPNSRLEETVLLLYGSSLQTNNIERCLDGYQHPDEWTGGAWLTTDTGKTAVVFAGTKGIGERYWYGFVNPAGAQYACVEEDFIGQFTLCRLADGSPCPDEVSAVCDEPASLRGWWSSEFTARFIFYNPAEFAKVAAGEIEPWHPQPYAYLDFDEHLFHNPSAVDTFTLGTGIQRRYRLGDIAYDRQNGIVYVLELFADEARPVVHVWQIQIEPNWANITALSARSLAYDGGFLAASFSGVGTGLYSNGSWDLLTTYPARKLATDGHILVASFEGLGVWLYDGDWTQLATATADLLTVDNGKVIASFDDYGIWHYDEDWQMLTPATARALAYDDGRLVASVDGFGTWLNDGEWQQLTAETAQLLALSGNDLVASFEYFGTWHYDGEWTNLTPATARAFALDNGRIAASVDGFGTWFYDGEWQQLTVFTAQLLGLDSGSLAASFEELGLWLYE